MANDPQNMADFSENPEEIFPQELLKKCWFLAGPTASGKSACAIELADLISAEILALDSMTLYKEMDIGTAKPNLQDQQKIRHHLLDVIEPHQEFSIASFIRHAAISCSDIVSRGKIPLFVGGTGLYLRALIRGMSTGPAGDQSFREQYQKQYHENPESLMKELELIDPQAAQRLHLNDSKRIIRALEVFHLTGKTLTEMQHHPARPVAERTPHIYWLNPPRDWLYSRINQRVIQMFEHGLESEVKHLMNRENGISSTARQGLGYKEVIDYLVLPVEQQTKKAFLEMINLIQTRTRQFAKRQMTWFRNLEECLPVNINGGESSLQLAIEILNWQKSKN